MNGVKGRGGEITAKRVADTTAETCRREKDARTYKYESLEGNITTTTNYCHAIETVEYF